MCIFVWALYVCTDTYIYIHNIYVHMYRGRCSGRWTRPRRATTARSSSRSSTTWPKSSHRLFSPSRPGLFCHFCAFAFSQLPRASWPFVRGSPKQPNILSLHKRRVFLPEAGSSRYGPCMGGACRQACPELEDQSDMKKKLDSNLSGNQVYLTNSFILPVKNMLCSEIQCQKGFN